MLKYKKIILVDDDSDDRQIFVEMLAEIDPDAAVDCAENGLELIAMLDKLKDSQLPEIIILDQNMPQMTGKECLIFLKASPRFRNIPVIVYSTYQIRDFYRECLGLGAQDVVPKPDTLQAYRDMIQQFLVISPELLTQPAPPEPLTPPPPPEPFTQPAPPEPLMAPPVSETITPPPVSETLTPPPVSETLTPPPSPSSEEHTPLPTQ